MFHGLSQALQLIEVGARRRWVAVLALALIVSVSEVVGAFLIFLLLGLISSPDKAVALPLVGNIRDQLPLSNDESLALVATMIAAFFVVRALLYLAQSYLQNRVAQNTGVRLSTSLLRAYLRMPYAVHVRRNSAELMRNTFGSVQEIVGGVLVPAVAVVTESLIVIGVFVGLLLIAPEVTIATAVLVLVLVVVLLRIVQPRMAALGVVSQETLMQTIKLLQQSLEGIRDIKILGREAFFEREFARIRATAARTSYMRSVFLDAPRAVIEAMLVLLIVGFLLVSVRSTASPEALLAVLGVFAYAVLRVLPSVNRIVANGNNIRFGSAAVDSVLQDLRSLDSRPLPPDPVSTGPGFRRELRLDHVDFRYDVGAPLVLTDINLVVAPGESVGIVGATGAGKSTLLDVVLGLLPPTAGIVAVDGRNVHDNLRAWHRQLGVVPQNVFLVDDTIRRNIALGEEDVGIDEDAVQDAVKIAQLDTFVDSLDRGLDTTLGERGVRLSGGQRQRVAIARALYRRPTVLVFDEGTSALDNITEAAFTEALESMRGRRTILTVAHRLTTVRNHDKIVVLEGGRILDVGSHDELMSRSDAFRAMTRAT